MNSLLNPNPLIDLDTLSFLVDPLGNLGVCDGAGNHFENVSPVRLFPLSWPEKWISIVDSASGKELICFEDIRELPADQYRILETELSRREFVPIIKRVLSTSGKSEPCEWKVETDRGPTSFILKHEDDVRRLGESGVLVVDSFGIRYFIPDRNTLDLTSRRIIEWYV